MLPFVPTSAEITRDLGRIASDGILLAIAWHVAVVAAVAALGSGWRPGRRTAGILLASLSASVGLVAWLAGNPFNGAVFTALAAAQVVAAVRQPAGPIDSPPGWALLAGAASVLFGLAYPQFLAGHPLAMYVLAAPVGLIPCPTLAVIIGFTLIAGGLRGLVWSAVLLAVATFYALFGAFKLGVLLDLGLLAAVAALGLLLISRERAHYR